MSIELPLYAQEKDNTCALACLRMVLAAYGTHLSENSLEAQARMDEQGTMIDELERLSRVQGLVANVRETTTDDLLQILAEGSLAIAYIDRAIFELSARQRSQHSLRHAKLHCVIPTRVTESYITYHDPLPPKVTRRTIALFELAHGQLAHTSVVCSKPDV